MLRIKRSVDINYLKRFGFKKHKKDKDEVIMSKWYREDFYLDVEPGCNDYGGFETYPIIQIFKDRTVILLKDF